MTTNTIDESQRTAARVAGWAYLSTMAIVVAVNFGIHDRLIAGDNAVETARNILAHEQLFRVGIAGNLLYCAGVIALLTALYVILRPVNRGLALVAAFLRLVWVLMWLAMTLHLFDAMRMLSGAGYLRPFEAAQMQSFARFYLSTCFDYYYVGLLFGAAASTVCGYLWFKSRYIPRWLAAFGVVSSAWCVACTLVFYIFPNFDDVVNLWWFDTPMAIFDIATSIWLLVKGLNPPRVSLLAAGANA